MTNERDRYAAITINPSASALPIFTTATTSTVHGGLVKTYYAQRSSVPGTLIISEATFIVPQAAGYANVPGIWNDTQIDGWKKVFVSRELKTAEIKEYVQLYSKAASNAIEAGFDGVEVHAANGYILDQFLQTMSSERTDEYGGSVDNRVRFPLEVSDAVVETIDAERTVVHISPWYKCRDMGTEDPLPDFATFVERIRDGHPNFAYIHVVEPRVHGIKYGGLVAFVRHFIANLVEPFLRSHRSRIFPCVRGKDTFWHCYDRDTFYTTKAAAGYTDYPFANSVVAPWYVAE
ncbi:hypothetical protein EDB92DRAFT_1932000 [Lactarius akahatsu]|uniref:NADH:flavin oxidoreductase/NADH oxidase N-terminal domain-containing protein n=1 Tax=Lactarius akahatsu TaxID=416441 RepID=A0AAD4LUM7_9AGAM|nr:hypothetical protein EDB92DRAFT_1932000 [Lactarius akahatsu]